jgi:formylglycine-generating enzyme required for sulfatase activity
VDASLQPLLDRLDSLSEEFRELREGVRRAILVADLDPEMALTRARKVLEYVVRDVYERRVREPAGTRPLENLLQRLVKDKFLPGRLDAYANAIRQLGNVGTHSFGEKITAADVNQSLSQLTFILEWYFEHERPDPGGAKAAGSAPPPAADSRRHDTGPPKQGPTAPPPVRPNPRVAGPAGNVPKPKAPVERIDEGRPADRGKPATAGKQGAPVERLEEALPAEGAKDRPVGPSAAGGKMMEGKKKGGPGEAVAGAAKSVAMPVTRNEGNNTTAKGMKEAGDGRDRPPAKGSRKWLSVLVVGGAVLLLAGALGLWAVFRLKTADGLLVVEVNEPNPDVYVDGDKMTVIWGKDGTTAEIRLKPGTRKVEVKKDGFTVFGEEVELQAGQRRVLTARLVPPAAPGPAGGDIVAKVKKVAGIDLVSMPAGEFHMGSDRDDKDAFDVEKPRHKVRITRPFYLGKYKVTVGQFKRFVAATGYQTEAEKAGDLWTWEKPGFQRGFDQTDEHPVVCVSWNDADAFCRWLAQATGAPVRLPREAEWEYSCRAGTATKFSFGDNEMDLGDYAWYSANSGGGGTHPCGLKKPNAFGLYDMHGLAWEWCADGKRTYRDQEETDPEGPMGAGASRVIRGGSWGNVPQACRAANRADYAPSVHWGRCGFRVLASR